MWNLYKWVKTRRGQEWLLIVLILAVLFWMGKYNWHISRFPLFLLVLILICSVLLIAFWFLEKGVKKE